MFPIFVYFANYNLSNTFYGCRYSAPLKGREHPVDAVLALSEPAGEYWSWRAYARLRGLFPLLLTDGELYNPSVNFVDISPFRGDKKLRHPYNLRFICQNLKPLDQD